MSIQKTKYRSPYDIELEGTVRKLSQHYPLDEEKKSFEIPLRYEKASDLFDENVDAGGNPKISDDVTDKMAQLLDDIPDGYRAKFIFTIEDYEEYTAEQILEGINDALSFRHLRYLRESTKADFRTGFMMVTGMVLILLMTIGKFSGWWGEDDVISKVLDYMLDTFGCVLIWEAFYTIFLDRSDEVIFEKKMSKKVQFIGLYRDGEDHALSGESSQRIMNVMAQNRKDLVMKKLLKFSGFSLFFLAAWELLDPLSTLTRIEGEAAASDNPLLNIIMSLLISALCWALGFIALRAYVGKFRRIILGMVLTVLTLFILVIDIIILHAIEAQPQEMIAAVFIFIAECSFIAGVSMYIAQFRRANRAALREEEISA